LQSQHVKYFRYARLSLFHPQQQQLIYVSAKEGMASASIIPELVTTAAKPLAIAIEPFATRA